MAFPSSPTNGQVYTVSGTSYIYDSTYGVWNINTTAVNADTLDTIDSSQFARTDVDETFGCMWLNNQGNSGNYNEGIRLYSAPNGSAVITFNTAGTTGSSYMSLIGNTSYYEHRWAGTAIERHYNNYVYALGSYRAPIFYDSNNTAYYADFSSTGTSINTAGDIVSNSDRNLKENIAPITDALNKVRALNGVTFNKIGETDRKTGVIAQDVEAVLPEAVTQQGEFKSVAYGNMVGLLIEAIKEQQTQIEMLKQELIALRGDGK